MRSSVFLNTSSSCPMQRLNQCHKEMTLATIWWNLGKRSRRTTSYNFCAQYTQGAWAIGSNIVSSVKELSIWFRKYSNPEILTTAQWQTVLKLSENFGMDDIRQKAVRNLKDFFAKDPIDALICARQNGLDEWTEPLIEKIVEMRREPTKDELEKVGTPLAIKIAWALGAAGTPMSLDSPGNGPSRKRGKAKKKGQPSLPMWMCSRNRIRYCKLFVFRSKSACHRSSQSLVGSVYSTYWDFPPDSSF